MKRLATLAVAGLLAGCSLGSIIKSDSIDYTQTYDEVTNIGLVTNILRARDFAPLNFSTLTDLRTGLTAGATIGTSIPIGPLNKSTARGTVGTGTPGISLAINPSFEIAPLDTQEFTRGILTPLDPVVAKYYFDRAFPQKLLVYLFFERISAVPPGAVAQTRNRDKIPDYFNDPTQPEQLEKFAAAVDRIFADTPNDMHVIRANRYMPLIPIGPSYDFKPSNQTLRDLLNVDPAKHRLFYDRAHKQIQLYAVSEPEVVFCRDNVPLPLRAMEEQPHLGTAVLPPNAPTDPAARAKLQKQLDAMNQAAEAAFAGLRNTEKSVCNAPSATMHADTPNAAAAFGTIYLRSVEGMIQYLGALVRNPASAAVIRKHTGYALMALSPDSAGSRFGVAYYGATYYVKDSVGRDDRTLQVLALLSQLLNLNKVAKEIPSTRAVDIVP